MVQPTHLIAIPRTFLLSTKEGGEIGESVPSLIPESAVLGLEVLERLL